MKKLILIVGLVVFASGCASIPKKDYTKFYSAAPRSILVVPVVNQSVNVDAPAYFLSSISIPIAEQGYYVFPVNMIKRVLEDNGLSDADLVHNAPVEKLSSLFSADTVLYVKIKRWDARYLFLSTTVTVELEYIIKEGKTGETLWQDDRIIQYTPQTTDTGNPIATLVVMAITAAVEKAAPNYMPLAKQANAVAFTFPGPGIPPGPYSGKENKQVATKTVVVKPVATSTKDTPSNIAIPAKNNFKG